MRLIGIDASRAETNEKSGTENYSYQIIKAIASTGCQDELRLYKRADGLWFDRSLQVEEIKIGLSFMWTQLGLAAKTWTDKIDVLFVPAHVVPFMKNPLIPVVVTVHDLRTEFLPQHSSLLQKFYLNRFTEKVRAMLASHIIAVSESTKNDIISRLGVSSEKITVVYEGVDHLHYDVKKLTDQSKCDDVLSRYEIANDYLLFVGTIQPRKNLVRLMQAFAQVASERQGLDLVVAGRKGWMYDDILATPAKLGLSNRIRFIDYVKTEDLPYLYGGAKALVFPSLYEGFGLPILESFAMGTPVLTSNISSMPEVGGEFAVYVEPTSVDDISRGIFDVLKINAEPQSFVDYSKNFSWEKAGRQTLKILQDNMR